MYGGNFQAISFRKPAKNGVECREHFADALRSVIRDLRASGKSFGARALKNDEIRFREGALQRRIQSFHHSNVQNIERWAVQRDPGRTALDTNRNGLAGVGHNRGKARVKEFICPEIWEGAVRKKPESLRGNPRRDST